MSFNVVCSLLLVLLVRSCLACHDHTSINTLSSALLFVLCVAIRLLSFGSSLYCCVVALCVCCKSSLLAIWYVHSFQNQNDLNHTNKNIFILVQFSKYISALKLYNIVFLYVVYSALILQDDHAAQTKTL